MEDLAPKETMENEGLALCAEDKVPQIVLRSFLLGIKVRMVGLMFPDDSDK